MSARTQIARAFGRVLREARKRKGLSQEKMAADAGLERTYPSMLERGGLQQPTLSVLLSLAAVVDTTGEALVAATWAQLRERGGRS
jgi:transcriptional regulator with XRE-family HTH domain